MLDFVGVLGSVAVHALHAAAFGRALDADLGGMDVIVHAIERGNDDYGRDALDKGEEVVCLVDGASAELVLVEATHSPAKRSLLLS